MMEISTALLFAFPVLLGVFFLLLANWARQKNRAITEETGQFLYRDFWLELRRGRIQPAVRKYFLGSVHEPMASAGRFLAAAVILTVVLVLILVSVTIFVGGR